MSFLRVDYKLQITLQSPLSIGSGSNENTDKDLILDSRGLPFIPATSLAGVLRHDLENRYGRETANIIFGFIPSSREENEKAKKGDPRFIERKSLVSVYDGTLTSNADQLFITNRDMVALENKVGIKGAKFDMEAVEPGAVFTAYLELKGRDHCDKLEAAFSAMNSGILRLGTKVSRGYGQVSLHVSKKVFTCADDWLDFDMQSSGAWTVEDRIELPQIKTRKIRIGLRQKGGISIREYTTEPSTEEKTMPDYITMGLHLTKEKDRSGQELPVPVIPGTSWAGAFRDRFTVFAGEEKAEVLFGYVHQDGSTQKSLISFEESIIKGGIYKNITRNAIDRFTGGTKDTALYTEKAYFCGNTELNILFSAEPEEEELKALAACLADLHNGLLSVGGLTSVGRGLFEITKLNGRELSEEEKKEDSIYNTVLQGVGIENE